MLWVSMAYTVRKTQLSDIDYLADVERSAGKAFETIPDLAWIANGSVMSAQEHDRAINSGLSWVAFETSSQSIAGFITAEVFQDDIYVTEISVGADHQRKGIGSELFEGALVEAKALGMKAVTLTTFVDVPWNAPYYERLGFIILPSDTVPTYLNLKLQKESAAGLPLNRRCAMRKMLPN